MHLLAKISSKCGQGGGGQKIRNFCGCHQRMFLCAASKTRPYVRSSPLGAISAVNRRMAALHDVQWARAEDGWADVPENGQGGAGGGGWPIGDDFIQERPVGRSVTARAQALPAQ